MSKQPGRQIVVWLQHFGLTSKAVSIDVHTDSERAVGEIIGNSNWSLHVLHSSSRTTAASFSWSS